jgi:hypothetical protein
VTAEAWLALAARCDGSHEHALSDRIARNPGTEFVDYSDGFMANDCTRLDRIFALDDVNVGAADGRESDLNYGFTVPGNAGSASLPVRTLPGHERHWLSSGHEGSV